MFIENSRILFLSPHPDDIEMGCGGSIRKLIEHNNEIYCAVFSNCDESLPEGFDKGTALKEFYQSMDCLGVNINKIYTFNYRVRYFSYSRQEILEDLVILKKNINPDIVFCPSMHDVHQDHATVANEAVRCFKSKSSILCYELIWNKIIFNNQLYIELSEEHLKYKMLALSKYKSQQHRNYSTDEFIKSLAIVRGVQNGVKYAENFEVIKIKI